MASGRRWRTSTEVGAAAKRLRQPLTPAEAILWERLRDRRLHGIKFRRQHAFQRFVLDFYAAEASLVIELDGSVHDNQEQIGRDLARTEVLQQHGLTVLRFTNDMIIHHLPDVLHRITTAAQTTPPLPTIPSPAKRERGGRAQQGRGEGR